MCTAAVLAGGRGRRLGGRHKALLALGDGPIIERQLNILRPVVDSVAIVANDRDRYLHLGVPVWPDVQPGAGPLGGILTALAHAADAATLVVAGDMPFLTSAFLRYLVHASGKSDAVDVTIPRPDDGYQPLCAVYQPRCLSVIRRHVEAGSLKVTDILAELRVRELHGDELSAFDPNETLFFNLNTPEDYTRGLAIASREELEP